MSSTNNEQTPREQPGLVAGHAEYAKGAVQAAVGAVTGSHAWTSSGEQAKAHGVSSMKAAAEQRDPQQQGWGKAEELAGRAAGCEGMQAEGAASKKEE